MKLDLTDQRPKWILARKIVLFNRELISLAADNVLKKSRYTN